MSSGRDPWSDPATPTEQGAPYAGPPATAPPSSGWAPPGHGMPAHPPSGYPAPGYGYPAPWPMPRAPRRPGQVIGSAVLAFVQAALVLIASLYLWFFASIVPLATAGAPTALDVEGLATEGSVLAAVQVVSAVLLVTAGVLALNRRTRSAWRLLVAGHALQIVLCVYWLVRLLTLADDVPGADADAVLLTFPLFFAAAPVVGLGLVLAGAARRWFALEQPAAPAPS